MAGIPAKPHEVHLRPATADDSEFVYAVKKAALGEYVRRAWGWDEAFQRDYHHKYFLSEEVMIINFNGSPAGYMIQKHLPDRIEFASLHLMPDYQRKGIGSYLLLESQEKARRISMPVRLRVLNVNPAKNLYESLGFETVTETDTHSIMEWRPTV